MIYHFNPTLSHSQLEFRIRLAEKRLESYPLNSLDFIMMDLEHPKTKRRHADQCTCDLTGRTVEFLAAAHRILPDCDDSRLHELFRRMSLQGDHPILARRYLPYLLYSGDGEAFKTVKEQYDRWADMVEADPDTAKQLYATCSCRIEGIADFYAITGDQRYVSLAKAIARISLSPFENSHSHGEMSIHRAMLKMGFLSGDPWFTEQVRPYIEKIQTAQYADGSVSECFPRSFRNEGCSIADWIMLNLRYWDITGDEAALDRAEHSMMNGLFFNQFVTGGFGHRKYSADGRGYGSEVEEAWWCCTQTGGMAMVEFAEHAVVLHRDDEGKETIRVNYPIPGSYRINNHGKEITVRIISEYPATYDVNIRVIGGGDIPLTLRKPYYTADVSDAFHCTDIPNIPDGKAYNASYPIGHYAEERDGGWVVKYGPLMLAPLLHRWNNNGETGKGTGIPEGYISESMGSRSFFIVEPKEKDEYGFWKVACGNNLPTWIAFDDGAGSPTGTMQRAPANITVWDAAKGERTLCFHPLCYQTSNLTLRDVVMSFGFMRHK